MVLMGLHPNAELKPHKTNGVISVQVLEGGDSFYHRREKCFVEEATIDCFA